MRIDYIAHALAGYIIGVHAGMILIHKTGNEPLALFGSFGIAVFCGVLKELFDKFIMKGTFDKGDLAFTSIGGALSLTWLFIYTTWVIL